MATWQAREAKQARKEVNLGQNLVILWLKSPFRFWILRHKLKLFAFLLAKTNIDFIGRLFRHIF